MKLPAIALFALLSCAAFADGTDPDLFVAKGRDLTSIRYEATVTATAAQVFDAWTTPEGVKGFLGVDGHIELRVGGPFELFFGAANPPGSRGSEGCVFLSYVPDRMVSFTWNAPPHLKEERAKRTWVTVFLHDAGEGKTRVELIHAGFGEGGTWKDVQAYFDKAWPSVLRALATRSADLHRHVAHQRSHSLGPQHEPHRQGQRLHRGPGLRAPGKHRAHRSSAAIGLLRAAAGPAGAARTARQNQPVAPADIGGH
jgi:uncharacterized protein YndB with AHSA1/START domain